MMELNRTTANCKELQPIKVIQFGEGNFLRAFVDWIFDNINEKNNFHGSIAMVQPIENGLSDLINKQEGLYHVFTNGLVDGNMQEDIRLVKSVATCINPFQNFQTYLQLAHIESVEFVVSNTTEAGIEFIEEDYNDQAPAKTYPGKLTQLLFERFKYFNADVKLGLTLLPCELINYNAVELKSCIVKYIKHWNLDPNFEDWIDSACSFHNTLVDRIVTGYPKDTIEEYQQKVGFNDNLVVTAEHYHIWVIENHGNEKLRQLFAKTDLNVQLVKDMQPYRSRKVRVLNGAHTSMVPVGLLAGKETVRETVETPFTDKFVSQVIYNEIISILDFPEDEINAYAKEIIARFKNEAIVHPLASIALNSISKFKVRVLPTIIDYYSKHGKLPKNLVFAFAALLYFYKGEVAGKKMPVNDADEIVEKFSKYWLNNDVKEMTHAILADTSLWGINLLELNSLNEKVIKNIEAIQKVGIAEAWKNL